MTDGPGAVRRDLLRAGVAGCALLALTERAALGQTSDDIQIMQTAASIENVLIVAYNEILKAEFVTTLPSVVQTYFTTARSQHLEHIKAFNTTTSRLRGKPQTEPNPVLVKVVNDRRPNLRTPTDVIELALALETGAAQTYVKDTELLDDADARKSVASVMGVEAQHVAFLNAVKTLIGTGQLGQLSAFPRLDLSQLPPEAGRSGFPDTFLPTTYARPADEGIVK